MLYSNLIFPYYAQSYYQNTKNLKRKQGSITSIKSRKQAKPAINELTRVIQRQVYPQFWLDSYSQVCKFAKSRDKLVSKSLLSIHLQLVWLVSYFLYLQLIPTSFLNFEFFIILVCLLFIAIQLAIITINRQLENELTVAIALNI